MSDLAAKPRADDLTINPDDAVIELTEVARAKLLELRETEEEGPRLGLRVEVTGERGQEFVYELSFQVVTQAELSDVVRNHGGMRVIVPASDADKLQGSTLDYVDDGLVMRNPNTPAPIQLEGVVKTGEVADRVRLLLDTDINPALAAHGGFVELYGVRTESDADIVYMTMGGGCQGCAMSRMTMMSGVQTAIQEAIPSVSKVVDVTDHTAGSNPYFTE